MLGVATLSLLAEQGPGWLRSLTKGFVKGAVAGASVGHPGRHVNSVRTLKTTVAALASHQPPFVRHRRCGPATPRQRRPKPVSETGVSPLASRSVLGHLAARGDQMAPASGAFVGTPRRQALKRCGEGFSCAPGGAGLGELPSGLT